MVFEVKEYGAKLVYADLGMGGLGVFVRAGLVKPPSLVSSAVEAKLALLIIDRRRVRSVVKCISDFAASFSGAFWNALVRSDSLRSACGRTMALWKPAGA